MKDVNLLKSNGVNVDASLELFGDMDSYNETLNDFLLGVDEKVKGLTEYKANGDMPNYAILVHSLKSDARYLGFTKLAELSLNQEMESKASNSMYIYDHFNELMEETNRIIKLTKDYLGVSSPAPVIEVPKKEESSEKKTILVVDDSDVIRKFVTKIFADTYNIVGATDGREAIDIVTTRNDGDIACMLLDLNMPNLDGFAVLDFFRDNGLFVKIPVSIITGEDTKDMIAKAFTYPIVDVLGKPFNENNVKTIVTKTIGL